MVILPCKIILSPTGKSQKINLGPLCLKDLASAVQVTFLKALVSRGAVGGVLNTN